MCDVSVRISNEITECNVCEREDDDGQDVPTFGDLHHKRDILHISGALEFVHVIWVTRFPHPHAVDVIMSVTELCSVIKSS